MTLRGLETLEGSFQDMSKAVETINSNEHNWKKEKEKKSNGYR